MSHSHQFPPLKESDVRRLGSTTAFQKGLRLWDDGSVHNPMVSLQDAAIFADVLVGPQQHFKVMAQHRAGDEFTAACDCGQNAVCSHVVAALLAWAHEGYGFAQVAQPSAEVAPEGVQQLWREYLQHANMQHLRAVARRHQFKLKGNDRAGALAQMVELLSAPETPQRAMSQLSEAQRRVLHMLFVLSDGQPDTLAPDVQHALGWQSLSEVEDVLRELSEWGLVVSVPSQWHRSPPYSLSPNVAALLLTMSALTAEKSDDSFDKPRNGFVAPYAHDLQSLPIARSADSVLEILWLAQHLPLQLRPTPPEPAQARTLRILRHWPYVVDELMELQVKPGWLHQSESVLTVPPPAPRYDDESLARLRELTGDDALSEFVGHLLPTPPTPPTLHGSEENTIPSPVTRGRAVRPAPDDIGVGVFSLYEIFAQWQRLVSWTELWLAQHASAFTARRAVMGTRLSYLDWLHQLARGRRFIIRVLALLEADRWYDFDSLLQFVHATHADFLRDRSLFPSSQPVWWLEVRGRKVDPQDCATWRESYGLFIEHVLRDPLRWFGAVELALSPAGALQAFQITPMGEALLRNHERHAPIQADAPLRLRDDLSAQLPLGRHDIGAYRILERLARFERAQNGCAHYRFDARQAHATFEHGLTADDVIAQLEELTRAPLPPAVRAQWNEWWSRYAQLRWYDGLTLIEFADDYALQELLAQTDLGEHLIFTFGSRLVAVRPDSAEAVTRQLVKKGYTPKIE